MTNHPKRVREPLVHLTRRLNFSPKYAWCIRIGAFVLSILVCAIVTVIMTPKVGFGTFFGYLFEGAFGGMRAIWKLLRDTAILLLLALAVTPCFKMRYWNIGGEGQALMGCFGAALIIRLLYGAMPLALLVFVALVVAICFAVVWAVLPALFKAKWNTNETLLTLMFNYIAGCLSCYLIKKLDPGTTGSLSFLSQLAGVGNIGGNQFILTILIVAVITVLMAIYLKYSKHGYEIAVVGESPNTARYVGINNKKVIIRTLVLCGVLCGIAGFIMVVLKDQSFKAEKATDTTLGGLGFTAVLVSWLANFNPLAMVLTSFLVVFISMGGEHISAFGGLKSANYPSVLTGIFFFFIIATEFFINFKINFRKTGEIPQEPDDDVKAQDPPDPIETDAAGDAVDASAVEAAIDQPTVSVLEDKGV